MQENTQQPSLFGLIYSNRDFTKLETWGKNSFNSSFPAALACYMNEIDLCPAYICLQNMNINIEEINVEKIFNIDPKSPDIYFSFETVYSHYEMLVINSLPRVDLVIIDKKTGKHLTGLEIKLTALPDETTCLEEPDNYGCELVVRPDTIVYLACSIAKYYDFKQSILESILSPNNELNNINWAEQKEIIALLPHMCDTLSVILDDNENNQIPFILQPIWKTKGKSSKLSEDCLDIFTWSNLAFTKFIINFSKDDTQITKITRANRTLVWIIKMLYEFSINQKFDYRGIIDTLSYNTKNDKAFSAAGKITQSYMRSRYLIEPRIHKEEIKNIILGDGQKLLSPERRFDAIIVNSDEISGV